MNTVASCISRDMDKASRELAMVEQRVNEERRAASKEAETKTANIEAAKGVAQPMAEEQKSKAKSAAEQGDESKAVQFATAAAEIVEAVAFRCAAEMAALRAEMQESEAAAAATLEEHRRRRDNAAQTCECAIAQVYDLLSKETEAEDGRTSMEIGVETDVETDVAMDTLIRCIRRDIAELEREDIKAARAAGETAAAQKMMVEKQNELQKMKECAYADMSAAINRGDRDAAAEHVTRAARARPELDAAKAQMDKATAEEEEVTRRLEIARAAASRVKAQLRSLLNMLSTATPTQTCPS